LESKEKAEILSNQFKSVFTKPKPNISTTVLPQRAGSTIQNLKITVEGVEKLLKNTNPSDSPTLHSRWLLFLKVMIISL
jgi:hypothetical protein